MLIKVTPHIVKIVKEEQPSVDDLLGIRKNEDN